MVLTHVKTCYQLEECVVPFPYWPLNALEALTHRARFTIFTVALQTQPEVPLMVLRRNENLFSSSQPLSLHHSLERVN
jgi:hypothetical protein